MHGFLGWGRDEMGSYYYWGGKTDMETELEKAGYRVYTVSMGPVSPNWHRAIEAFYQIKGGQIDYGIDEAEKTGIIQKPEGKIYDGLYPEWGTDHPVHIVGHSQGGLTARMLEVLLDSVFVGEDSPLLSQQHKGWIKSITTISTPHNGSTLVPLMLDVFPFALGLAPWLGGIDNQTINKIYSFDLEHWRLERNEGESFRDYYRRIFNSPLINEKNLCSWDLSISGAAEFNAIYTPNAERYYFSIPTFSSVKRKSKSTHKPDSTSSFHLWPTTLLIGSDNNAPDSTWFENDGVCNTVSMTQIGDNKMPLFNGNPIQGKWVAMPPLNMDHQAVVGHGIGKKERETLLVLYMNHCKLLYSL